MDVIENEKEKNCFNLWGNTNNSSNDFKVAKQQDIKKMTI